MNPLQKVLDFANWLDKNITDDKFNFEYYVTETLKGTACGAVCCAIGWLPRYDSRVKWYVCACDDEASSIVRADGEYMRDDDIVAEVLGMDEADVGRLFYPNNQDCIEDWGITPVCHDDCTVKQLTDAMRHYVDIKS